MGTAYLYGNGGSGGGSGGFGLQIVEGLVRPKNPTQGMIWAKTEHKVTHYDLSATKPENPVEGTLWISISDSGDKKIVSPVSKEWITVYPLSAEQYISGEWMSIETMSYQDGEWVDWWNGELYDYGKEYESITGGWTSDGFAYSGATVVAGFTKSSDRMSFCPSGSIDSAMTIGGCKNPIDLTLYETLRVTYVNKALTSGQGLSLFIATGKDLKTTKVASASFTSAVDTVKTEDIPISAISGKCYIAALGFRTQYGEILSVKLVE